RELEDRRVIERRPRADRNGHEDWLTPAGEAVRPGVGALGGWGFAHADARLPTSDRGPPTCCGAFASAAVLTRFRGGGGSSVSSFSACRQTAPDTGSCGWSSNVQASTCA